MDGRTPSNGCMPRYLQLVSDTCAPVQTCRTVHDALAKQPGRSHLEAKQCTVSDDECFSRLPRGWPPDQADNEQTCQDKEDYAGREACSALLDYTLALRGQSTAQQLENVCSNHVIYSDCKLTCCIRQTFDASMAQLPKSPAATQPFYKASQWSTLWAEHAQMLVEKAPAQEHIWQSSFVPDEHFVVNNLVLANANFGTHGLTHVMGYEWVKGTDGAHAVSVDCGLPVLRNQSRSWMLFGRDALRKSTALLAPGLCLKDGPCKETGHARFNLANDTEEERDVLENLTGQDDVDEARKFSNVMLNAEKLGQAFIRKVHPDGGCVDRLIQHHRALLSRGRLDSRFVARGSSFEERVLDGRRAARVRLGTARPLHFIHIPKVAGTVIEELGDMQGMRWGAKNPWLPSPNWWQGTEPNTTKVNMKASWDEPGSWMYDWSGCRAPWHEPRARMRAHGVDPYAGGSTFCVVRDPADRAISQFSWAAGIETEFGGMRRDAEPVCSADALNAYIGRTLASFGKYLLELQLGDLSKLGVAKVAGCHWLPQYLYADGCDTVVLYDELQEQLTQLLVPYGFNESTIADVLNRKTVSKGFSDTDSMTCTNSTEELRASLSDEVLQELRRVYARDYDLLEELRAQTASREGTHAAASSALPQ